MKSLPPWPWRVVKPSMASCFLCCSFGTDGRSRKGQETCKSCDFFLSIRTLATCVPSSTKTTTVSSRHYFIGTSNSQCINLKDLWGISSLKSQKAMQLWPWPCLGIAKNSTGWNAVVMLRLDINCFCKVWNLMIFFFRIFFFSDFLGKNQHIRLRAFNRILRTKCSGPFLRRVPVPTVLLTFLVAWVGLLPSSSWTGPGRCSTGDRCHLFFGVSFFGEPWRSGGMKMICHGWMIFWILRGWYCWYFCCFFAQHTFCLREGWSTFWFFVFYRASLTLVNSASLMGLRPTRSRRECQNVHFWQILYVLYYALKIVIGHLFGVLSKFIYSLPPILLSCHTFQVMWWSGPRKGFSDRFQIYTIWLSRTGQKTVVISFEGQVGPLISVCSIWVNFGICDVFHGY